MTSTHDEYATYIQSLMESVWSHDTSADETREFEVRPIEDKYYASVKMTGTKVVGEERMEFLTESARTPVYNKVGFYGHSFVELLSKMQDAGFELNSIRQFTDEVDKPELDVLFVSRDR